jgi:hypothetical protein
MNRDRPYRRAVPPLACCGIVLLSAGCGGQRLSVKRSYDHKMLAVTRGYGLRLNREERPLFTALARSGHAKAENAKARTPRPRTRCCATCRPMRRRPRRSPASSLRPMPRRSIGSSSGPTAARPARARQWRPAPARAGRQPWRLRHRLATTARRGDRAARRQGRSVVVTVKR